MRPFAGGQMVLMSKLEGFFYLKGGGKGCKMQLCGVSHMDIDNQPDWTNLAIFLPMKNQC